MGKRYSAAFKTRVVQDILKDDKTIAQTSSEHGAHPSQLNGWKTLALKGMPSLFGREQKAAAADRQAQETHVNEL